MPDAPTNAPEASETPAVWITATEAARRLGVSEKSVWRHAKAGQLEARKVVSRRGGFVWEIALEATDRPDKPDRTATEQSNGDAPVSRSNPTGRPDKSDRPTDQTATGQNEDVTARLLAHLERENAFLRATVEQHQRSEAELRASLREALKIAPRQLAAPDQSARNGPGARQSGAANTVPTVALDAKESKGNGQQDDEMDDDELLELCRRISR